VIAAALDHLWQSTLFGGCAWALTTMLRGNAARVRHAVWFAASMKFLVPFSVLAAVGTQLQPHVGLDSAPLIPVAASDAMSLASPGRAIAADPRVSPWLALAGAVWSIGFMALAVRWCIRWRRVARVLHAASPCAIAAPIPVRHSAGLREPGVVGIIRPVLLLPAGIESRLTTAQLAAVLEHELSHVRRHDNLTAALQMLVEALFWFHPLVWWIGARLVDERERACDEAVVRSGSDRHAYAQGILTVCRMYVASDLVCVAGVSGADLKTRLEAIMKKDEVKELGVARRLALGGFALAALAGPIAVGLAMPASNARTAEQAANPVGKIVLLAGKRVRLSYKNVDVRELIRAMAEAGSVNILVSDKVAGTVTVELTETTWDHALDIILGSMSLVKHEKDGILFIEPASA
jgi:bla regulator protein blaR1